MPGSVRRINLDKVGAFASAACAVHCLVTGIALGVLSVLGLGFIGSTTTDIAFLTITLSVASIAIFTGYRRHRSMIPASIFMLGVTAILLSHFAFGKIGESHEPILVTLLSVGGGCCLVAFHVVNLRLGQACMHHNIPIQDK